MTGKVPPDQVFAVLRVCDLLDVLQQAPEGITLHAATLITQMPKTSVFRYLATLQERRYVERDPDTGVYRLGAAFLPVCSRDIDVLTERARGHLDQLREQFSETASLGLLDGNRILYLEVVESPKHLRVAHDRGEHEPVHATALGKALAAELADERVRELLAAEGMPPLTERTLTDPDRYLAELRAVRDRGWALEDGETQPGSRSVAVAVPGDHLLAGLSISAPAARLTLDKAERIASALGQHVTRIAAELRDGDGATGTP
jgi:IclR family acetate operon transcriptional repressor